jgi:hypothetical protein
MAGAVLLWDANTAAPANSLDCAKAPYSDRVFVCLENYGNGAGYAYRWECINTRSN